MFRKLTPSLFLLAAACGTRAPTYSAAASSVDAATPKGDEGDDASISVVDASVEVPEDAGIDAAPLTFDATPDGAADATDGASPDSAILIDASDAGEDSAEAPFDAAPAVVCPGGRNVFIANQSELGGVLGGVYSSTLTNLDSQWSMGGSPFTVGANDGPLSASLVFNSNSNVSPSAGTYSAVGAAEDAGVTLAFAIGNDSCVATGGSVTVLEDETDDAGFGRFLATFDLFCGVTGLPDDELTGCIRYEAESEPADASAVPAEPGYDSGIVDSLDGGADGDDPLAPCLGHPLAFYIQQGVLSATAVMVTESQGNWSAWSNSGSATLEVEAENEWRVELAGPPGGTGLMAGTTYDDAGILPGAGPYFSLEANGVACDSPNASFTLWDYADTGGDEASITSMTASFSATCSNGTVQGCVRFTQ